MTTNFDIDPNTQTVAAAWASSLLGQPEREVRFGFAPTGPTEAFADDEPRPDRKKAILAAALAAGVIAGSGIGVMLLDYTDSGQPTVVVPRSEDRLPSAPVAPPTESRTVGDNAPAPNPVVPQQQTGPAPVVPAPASDVGTPPAVTDTGPTVVVDVPIPDYPPRRPRSRRRTRTRSLPSHRTCRISTSNCRHRPNQTRIRRLSHRICLWPLCPSRTRSPIRRARRTSCHRSRPDRSISATRVGGQRNDRSTKLGRGPEHERRRARPSLGGRRSRGVRRNV